MSDITVTMRLFGAFREFGESVELAVKSGSSVAAIKQALGNALGERAQTLIRDSVLADDHTILPVEFIVETDAKLAILPPVCGG